MPRILIAEDERPTLDAMMTFLRARGHQVCGVVSAAEALATVDAFPPDVVISDYQLGAGVDGVELVRRLQGAGFRTPVLFLTGLPLAQVRKRAADLFRVSFLQKPATLTKVSEEVGKLLAGQTPSAS